MAQKYEAAVELTRQILMSLNPDRYVLATELKGRFRELPDRALSTQLQAMSRTGLVDKRGEKSDAAYRPSKLGELYLAS